MTSAASDTNYDGSGRTDRRQRIREATTTASVATRRRPSSFDEWVDEKGAPCPPWYLRSAPCLAGVRQLVMRRRRGDRARSQIRGVTYRHGRRREGVGGAGG